ncbi:UDP-N-acetylmuramyl peptide synthase [Bifidobacterium saguinibicoloris]|uniref:UDP-N-acetylmuramyl peptide synthase n=1 Tax=Bifidobacterium saguinibicoloris TaxID=2834433 RepID=UPI001C56DAB3|nr:UDP-N-acetylmuramyl peptide synthase [Bifidobacterium saguinibicoloris]MBW3081533.1 UDP-N-acetylmuramyl peptide synthase [Bifidobacterium saguinibicoloris]
MSAVNESIMQRMTLGHIVEHYGWSLVPPFATDVTVTSLADDPSSVVPGALYYSRDDVDVEQLRQVRRNGAYAAIVPHSSRALLPDEPDMPLLFAEPTDAQLGGLAAQMAGNPGNTLIVFAVSAGNPQENVAVVHKLARLLHMIGNPEGVISVNGSYSLDRKLDLEYPLGVLDVQRTLAICAEDGAAAVVVALDDLTVSPHALESVNVDVLGSSAPAPVNADKAIIERMQAEYGFLADEQMKVTTRTEESDTLARLTPSNDDAGEERRLSLAIAMMLAAGVRRSSIRSTLRVVGDLE